MCAEQCARVFRHQLCAVQPSSYCSEATALQLAQAAYSRGFKAIAQESSSFVELVRAIKELAWSFSLSASVLQVSRPTVGVGCTASLKTTIPKHGDHRCYVAVWSPTMSRMYRVTLTKDARSREDEDAAVSALVLLSMAEAMGLHGSPLDSCGALLSEVGLSYGNDDVVLGRAGVVCSLRMDHVTPMSFSDASRAASASGASSSARSEAVECDVVLRHDSVTVPALEALWDCPAASASVLCLPTSLSRKLAGVVCCGFAELSIVPCDTDDDDGDLIITFAAVTEHFTATAVAALPPNSILLSGSFNPFHTGLLCMCVWQSAQASTAFC